MLVCLSVFVCLCNQRNSITNNSRNSIFRILHFYCMQLLLENFEKNQRNSLYAGTPNTSMAFLVCVFLVYLDYTEHNEIEMHFCHDQKYVTIKIWLWYHMIINYQRDRKNVLHALVSMAWNFWKFTSCYFTQFLTKIS